MPAASEVGLPLADSGFVNPSFEYADSSPTDRIALSGLFSVTDEIKAPLIADGALVYAKVSYSK